MGAMQKAGGGPGRLLAEMSADSRQVWDSGRSRILHPLERELGEFAVQNVAFHGRADAVIAGSLAACIDRAQKLCHSLKRTRTGRGNMITSGSLQVFAVFRAASGPDQGSRPLAVLSRHGELVACEAVRSERCF